MKVYNFGSINIDEMFRVENISRPGETIDSFMYNRSLGGKGLNQSIALARANVNTVHIGIINKNDDYIEDYLLNEGISTEYLIKDKTETGRAIIQVSDDGENSIVLHAGANHNFSKKMIDRIIKDIKTKSIVLAQNETNEIDYLLKTAKSYNHKTILNMAPVNKQSKSLDLRSVDYLIINEIEGNDLTGESKPKDICAKLLNNFPNINVVLTLGAAGVYFENKKVSYMEKAIKTKVVDTTGAGDTFVGYFISGMLKKPIDEALKFANYASSLTIQQLGASSSIPSEREVERSAEFENKKIKL